MGKVDPGWASVDALFERTVVRESEAHRKALARNIDAGLPAIDVSPTQGKLLATLVQISGAKRILEIGTLGAYSTIWMAQAMGADGKIVTLEFDADHAEVARENLEAAGVSEQVEIVVGDATETVHELDASEPFDFVFIDADKKSNPIYVLEAMRLGHVGTVIVVDNVVREGRVADLDNDDPNLFGIREMFDLVAAEPRLEATAIQTVGSKGWDGFALIRVVK